MELQGKGYQRIALNIVQLRHGKLNPSKIIQDGTTYYLAYAMTGDPIDLTKPMFAIQKIVVGTGDYDFLWAEAGHHGLVFDSGADEYKHYNYS
jgi:hypothetical protein